VFASAEENPTSVCSDIVQGCVERPNHAREIVGASLAASGVAMMLVAIPAIVLGHDDKPRHGYRRSHGMTAAGGVFTHLGASMAAAGGAGMIADNTYGPLDGYVTETALLAVGGTFLALGVVLWAVGADRREVPLAVGVLP
jgi:hypothetical protein